MTTTNYPMRVYFDENGEDWVVEYPDLPGCIGVGDTKEKALANGEKVMNMWLEATKLKGNSIPVPGDIYSMEYSGRFNLRLPKSLHRELSIRADEERVSLNSLCTLLLTKGISKEYKTISVCESTFSAESSAIIETGGDYSRNAGSKILKLKPTA